jgi:hypothetical protein
LQKPPETLRYHPPSKQKAANLPRCRPTRIPHRQHSLLGCQGSVTHTHALCCASPCVDSERHASPAAYHGEDGLLVDSAPGTVGFQDWRERDVGHSVGGYQNKVALRNKGVGCTVGVPPWEWYRCQFNSAVGPSSPAYQPQLCSIAFPPYPARVPQENSSHAAGVPCARATVATPCPFRGLHVDHAARRSSSVLVCDTGTQMRVSFCALPAKLACGALQLSTLVLTQAHMRSLVLKIMVLLCALGY